MTTKIFATAVSLLTAILITGCGDKDPKVNKDQVKPQPVVFECKKGGELAPSWTCYKNMPDGFTYATVGSSEKSKAGENFTRRMAIADARSSLAQQIETLVKDKIENYTRAVGTGDREVVDKVNAAVSEQLAKVSLKGSRAIDSWETQSGTIYVLVGVEDAAINQAVKEGVKSSFKNDDASWQIYNSKQALEALNNSFPD